MTRVLAVAVNELHLARRDPAPILVMAVLPVVLMVFLRPSAALALHAEGRTGASGAEQVVPGIAVLCSFLLMSSVGLGVLRELAWGTWARVRATCHPAEFVAGKVLAPALVSLVQVSLYLLLGSAVLGLHFTGSWIAAAVMVLSLVCSVVAFGSTLAAFCRNTTQLAAAVNLSSLLLAGLGGAFVPLSSSPEWVQHAAPAVPSYWAMRGFRSVFLDGGGVADVALPAAVLLAFASAGFLVALAGFRSELERGN